MKFKNHSERMQHPQAQIISTHLWESSITVWKNYLKRDDIEFPDALIFLIETIQNNPNDLLAYIKKHQSALKIINKKAALVIALSCRELDSQTLDQINDRLNLSDETFFKLSAEAGNVELMQLLLKRNPGVAWKDHNIGFYDYAAFRWAASFGHRKVLVYLSEQAPDRLQVMIASKGYEVFRAAAAYGHQDVLDYLSAQAPDKLENMIRANNYQAFQKAAANGHLSVLRYLVEQVPDKVQAMIAADEYEAFREAASNNHQLVLEYLEAQAPDKLQAMIDAYQFSAFRNSAANGHLPIVEYLAEKAPDKLQAMIGSDHGHAFCAAAANGHLPILRFLAKHAPDKLESSIKSYNYCAFRLAAQHHHDDVMRFLLFNATAFAYAESHEFEFGHYTTSFIVERLDTLHRMKIDYGDDPIPLTSEEAKQLFYLARALIRRHMALDDLRLILELPEVRELAHQAITPEHPNELLRLAASIGNEEASTYLLTIPAVRREAEINNFYMDEYDGSITNLRLLAQDRESSMTTLSQGERERLDALSNHYLANDQRSPKQILEELRLLLIKRYEKNPPIITVSDSFGKTKNIDLPYSWESFNALSLSEKERQAALEAYYKNKNHTAWRFLEKPNPWMHPHAPYTNSNEAGQWSSFEEYAELIAVLFLAAKDEKTPGIDGYSIKDRVTQFIDELALIGRSHNWDNKNEKQQEYDDLTGDQPSCYSGTKRRLFQSVQGHPLLKQLTSELFQQELREFVWQHFQAVITKNNHQSLSTIWQKSIDIEELTNDEKDILSEINISKESQRTWLKKLEDKYGGQISRYETFLLQKFNLSNEDNHFIHFGYLGLDQLLNNPDFQKNLPETDTELTSNCSVESDMTQRFFSQEKTKQNNNNNISNAYYF